MRIDRHGAGKNDLDEQLVPRLAAGIEETRELPVLSPAQVRNLEKDTSAKVIRPGSGASSVATSAELNSSGRDLGSSMGQPTQYG